MSKEWWEKLGISREEWEIAQQVLPKPGEWAYKDILKFWDEEDKQRKAKEDNDDGRT